MKSRTALGARGCQLLCWLIRKEVLRGSRELTPRFCETKPKLLQLLLAIPLGDPRDVDVHGQRRRNAVGGNTGGLQALEFVQGLVEAPLYGCLVARELGEGVRILGVPGEGTTKRGPSRLLLIPKPPGP